MHPQYLDPAGLVALWREALLAQAVLAGRTRGYTRHPQLLRFLEQRNPSAAIAGYLQAVADEAGRRGYAFDRTRIASRGGRALIEVTDGQLRYEWAHLKRKLRGRSPEWYRRIARVSMPLPHPRFTVVTGEIAAWERI